MNLFLTVAFVLFVVLMCLFSALSFALVRRSLAAWLKQKQHTVANVVGNFLRVEAPPQPAADQTKKEDIKAVACCSLFAIGVLAIFMLAGCTAPTGTAAAGGTNAPVPILTTAQKVQNDVAISLTGATVGWSALVGLAAASGHPFSSNTVAGVNLILYDAKQADTAAQDALSLAIQYSGTNAAANLASTNALLNAKSTLQNLTTTLSGLGVKF